MSGAMRNCDKQKTVDDFIKKNDPYKAKEPLRFDLRGYAAYVKENAIKASDITPEIMRRFAK